MVTIKDKPPVLSLDEIREKWEGGTIDDFESFVAKSSMVHGGWYSYPPQDYISSRRSLTIKCPLHGEFSLTPKYHLRGSGCSQCKSDRRRSDNFVEKAIKIHGLRYDYSEVKYRVASEKVNIICPIHGVFEQTPNSHLRGSGCNKCSHDTLRMGFDEFLKKAFAVHNGFYSYEPVELPSIHTKISITCPIHGDFLQTPAAHIYSKQRCPRCSKSQNIKEIKEYKRTIPATIYHVLCRRGDDVFEKVGITRKDVNMRFVGYKNLEVVVIKEKHTNLYDAITIESDIKRELDSNELLGSMKHLKGSLDGWTECFPVGSIDIENFLEEKVC